jgi:hypothetical protein
MADEKKNDKVERDHNFLVFVLLFYYYMHMKTVVFFVLCFVASCSGPVDAPTTREQTYADTIALLDTAFVDPNTGHIRPPCSLSPDFCACMKNRGARYCP